MVKKWKVSVFSPDRLSIYYYFYCFNGNKYDAFKLWNTGTIEVPCDMQFGHDELMILPSLSNLVIKNYKFECRQVRGK